MKDKIDIPFETNDSEVKVAIQAAILAGKEIMAVYNDDFTWKMKRDESPITEADIRSNKVIKKILNKTKHKILSEEDKDDKSRLKEKILWVVDPLDGTSDFVGRTGEFTAMIALVEKGGPIIGVINWPVEKTMFVAQKGAGAFKYSNGEWKKIAVSQTNDFRKSRAVGSRNHLSDEEKGIIKKLNIPNFTSIGSSLKVCKISSGEADMYFTTTNKMKEWDTCASNCILSEAGGKMTDILGNEMKYNMDVVNHQNGILATNGLIHKKLVDEFKKL